MQNKSEIMLPHVEQIITSLLVPKWNTYVNHAWLEQEPSSSLYCSIMGELKQKIGSMSICTPVWVDIPLDTKSAYFIVQHVDKHLLQPDQVDVYKVFYKMMHTQQQQPSNDTISSLTNPAPSCNRTESTTSPFKILFLQCMKRCNKKA